MIPRRKRLSRRRQRRLESRIAWILGSPRSGSTWLFNMLAVDRRAVGLDEPTVGLHLGPLMMDYVSVRPVRVPADRLRVNDLRADLDTYFFSRRYEPVWRPLLRDLILGRIDAEVGEVAGRAGISDPIVLIKEPIGSQAADLLTAATPGSRLIFLLRDGRDVVDSELDAFGRGGWVADLIPDFAPSEDDRRTFVNARAHAWLCRTWAVERAYEAHPPELRYLVRYEELLADTEGVLGDLADWLGLGLSPDQVAEITERMAFEAISTQERGPGRFARAATPGLWRESMSAAEQELLEDVLGEKLRELGYE